MTEQLHQSNQLQQEESLLDNHLTHVLFKWFNSLSNIVAHHSTYMVARNVFLEDNEEYMKFIENLSMNEIVNTECVNITSIQLNKYLVNTALVNLCNQYQSKTVELSDLELFLVTLTVTAQILGNTEQTEKLRFIKSCLLKSEPVIRTLAN